MMNLLAKSKDIIIKYYISNILDIIRLLNYNNEHIYIWNRELIKI